MKYTIAILILIAPLLAGCAKNGSLYNEEQHLKIVVKSDGVIYADGTRCTLNEISRRLDVLKEKKGVVWYYRANPSGEPHPHAMETIKLIVDRNLPIAMYSKEDFSEKMLQK